MTKLAPLIISNAELGDVSFECPLGTWNVSRALRDCLVGKHGLWSFDVHEVFAVNDGVEIDEAKVSSMRADPARLDAAPPLIFIVEKGVTYLIDGHHRIAAFHRRGDTECYGYVIEEKDSAPYIVHYNGERIAPWQRGKQ